MFALRSPDALSCLHSIEETSMCKHSAHMFILAEFFEFITKQGSKN